MKLTKIPITIFRSLKQIPSLLKESVFLLKFIGILFLDLVSQVLQSISHLRGLSRILKPALSPIIGLLNRVTTIIDPPNRGNITAVDLISLSMHELKAKKVRTLITIGGMSIGFGSIIFLLSIGYGLQNLVISRVANLNEMKQTEVLVGKSSSLTITDPVIEKIKKISEVDAVFPQISTVAKISFNNSVSDAIAYGVTTRFLQESAVQPVQGSIFENEEYLGAVKKIEPVSLDAESSGTVAGISEEYIAELPEETASQTIRYAIYPLIWQPVYESPDTTSDILGYTQRQTSLQVAHEVWGQWYDDSEQSRHARDAQNKRYQSWTKDQFPLWKKEACDMTNPECLDKTYQLLKTNNEQVVQVGYITQESSAIERFEITIPNQQPSTEGETIQDVTFSLPPSAWVQLYTTPKSDTPLVLTATTAQKPTAAVQNGKLVLGDYYSDTAGLGQAITTQTGKRLGYWIQATFPIWHKIDCGTGCDDYYLPLKLPDGTQKTGVWYIKASEATIDSKLPTFPRGQVLGEATSSATQLVIQNSVSTSNATQAGNLDTFSEADELNWALIASQAGVIQPKQTEVLPTNFESKKVAIVNTSFLTLLGLTKENGLNQKFETKFVFDGKLFGNNDYRAETESMSYTIVGILPDEKTPFFYVPFHDLQGFAVTNYSQLGVMVKEKNQLAKVRTEVESLGFQTSSVADTVESINSLFGTLRIALLILGMVALGVAALGMFNTLTVSLLEKTRQVGLMKAMGMKSNEVKRLFLAESVIMGVSGGLSGLFLAFIAGKILSAILSSLAIAGGVGTVNISLIPVSLAVGIVVCSFAIGIVTGWYPSHRATKISALNALRYE